MSGGSQLEIDALEFVHKQLRGALVPLEELRANTSSDREAEAQRWTTVWNVLLGATLYLDYALRWGLYWAGPSATLGKVPPGKELLEALETALEKHPPNRSKHDEKTADLESAIKVKWEVGATSTR